MWALLTPRFWIYLALVSALAFTHGFAYKSGRAAVRTEELAKTTAAALVASENARLREQAAQKSNERVDRDYQTAKNRLAADKRITDDSLRELQAAINKPDLPASTPSGNHGTGGLERELLGVCAATLTQLGYTADRLENKVVALQSYIANVLQAK